MIYKTPISHWLGLDSNPRSERDHWVKMTLKQPQQFYQVIFWSNLTKMAKSEVGLNIAQDDIKRDLIVLWSDILIQCTKESRPKLKKWLKVILV